MEQKPIKGRINLRATNNAFITNIKSASTGVTKRCVCIPVDDNYIEENSYVQKGTGKEIRTAEMSVIMWPVSDEDKARFQEQYGREKKEDWTVRLDVSKNKLESMQQTNPKEAALLSYNDNGYDREYAKQHLPYLGQAYNLKSPQLPPEQVDTTTAMPDNGDDDLPF